MRNFEKCTCYNAHLIWPTCIFSSILTNKYLRAENPIFYSWDFLSCVFVNLPAQQRFCHMIGHIPLEHRPRIQCSYFRHSWGTYNRRCRVDLLGYAYGRLCWRALQWLRFEQPNQDQIRWTCNFKHIISYRFQVSCIALELEFAKTRVLDRTFFLLGLWFCLWSERVTDSCQSHPWKEVSNHFANMKSFD